MDDERTPRTFIATCENETRVTFELLVTLKEARLYAEAICVAHGARDAPISSAERKRPHFTLNSLFEFLYELIPNEILLDVTVDVVGD